MNTTPSKHLPKILTFYDLLKSFAVIIMVIDHVGVYFAPEDLWWRAVGRIGFPVWFFLLGYARGRDVSLKLWIGAVLLLLGNVVTGRDLFPLNALVTIALIRMILDPVMVFLLKNRWVFWGGVCALFLLNFLTDAFCEYGTQALMTAIFGYLVRRKTQINDSQFVTRYMMFAMVTFAALQFVSFGFDPAQFWIMIMGTMAVHLVLYFFEPRTYPEFSAKLPACVRAFLGVCGGRTLEIYVVHLLLFKMIAFLI